MMSEIQLHDTATSFALVEYTLLHRSTVELTWAAHGGEEFYSGRRLLGLIYKIRYRVAVPAAW